jgi:hypothetical protein
MQMSGAQGQSFKRDLRVLWFMWGSVVLLPIYFNGTRSVILKLCRATLTHENSQWFSIAACAILLPMAYGWKAGRRIGALVQFGLLGAIVLWLVAFDQSVLRDWLGYVGKLALVCAATAGLVSLMLWALDARRRRANTRDTARRISR